MNGWPFSTWEEKYKHQNNNFFFKDCYLYLCIFLEWTVITYNKKNDASKHKVEIKDNA